MEQMDITRVTRITFDETGIVSCMTTVSLHACYTDLNAHGLANKLKTQKCEDLTQEEQHLRLFFTPEARALFTVTVENEYVIGAFNLRIRMNVLSVLQATGVFPYLPSRKGHIQQTFNKHVLIGFTFLQYHISRLPGSSSNGLHRRLGKLK